MQLCPNFTFVAFLFARLAALKKSPLWKPASLSPRPQPPLFLNNAAPAFQAPHPSRDSFSSHPFYFLFFFHHHGGGDKATEEEEEEEGENTNHVRRSPGGGISRGRVEEKKKSWSAEGGKSGGRGEAAEAAAANVAKGSESRGEGKRVPGVPEKAEGCRGGAEAWLREAGGDRWPEVKKKKDLLRSGGSGGGGSKAAARQAADSRFSPHRPRRPPGWASSAAARRFQISSGGTGRVGRAGRKGPPVEGGGCSPASSRPVSSPEGGMKPAEA